MKKRFYLYLVLLTLPLLAHGTTPEQEARISKLISQMTVAEKVGQLNQMAMNWNLEEALAGVRAGTIGTIYNEIDPENINKLQHAAIEESRLGIPLVFSRDVIHGFRTIFPIPLGQGATWNPELVRKGCRVAAEEATSVGIRWNYSPMVDVSRDARWGRVAEGYGEDPLLTSRMGVAAIEGYQNGNLASPSSMAACVKHFGGYGAVESGRDYNTSFIATPQLYDVYLPSYQACAEAGAASFMTSFNDINGVPSTGNVKLLRDILRNKWGWNGVIVSDWNAISEMVTHGFVSNRREAAAAAARATVGVDMESHEYSDYLGDLVEKGEIPMETLDELVRNVLRLKMDLDLFDNPYIDMSKANRVALQEYKDAAQLVAEESLILLKNDGTLPLASGKKLFVTGPMSDTKHDQNGTWSFDMYKGNTVTPLMALRDMYGNKVSYVAGLNYSRDRDTAQFEEALKAASKADVILYFAGEEAVLSGEAHSRADITLPGAQSEYLRKLAATGKPVVTVVMAGRPLAIPEVAELSAAVVYCFHPGVMGGPALANMLSGKIAPGGKLPMSLPNMTGQCPIYYAHKNTGRPATEMVDFYDIPVEAPQTSTGNTSHFLDAGWDPLYPFGYGLSYTTFEYSKPVLSSKQMGMNGEITVSCTVTNTGSVSGSDVAQLYVRDLVGSLTRPVKELKDFEKFTLAPGESKTVTFTLKAEQLKFSDLDGNYIVEPGEFHLWVDNSSDCKRKPVKFTVVE